MHQAKLTHLTAVDTKITELCHN